MGSPIIFIGVYKVILREPTIKYKGYDPDKLSFKSTLRICCSCDGCGRVRWLPKQSYRDLCGSCATKNRPPISDETRKKLSDLNKGKNNIMFNKHPSKETRKKMSESHKGSNHYLYGKSMPKETKQKISNTKIKYELHKGENNSNYGKRGKDSSNWKGGISNINRDHVLPFSQCLKINKYFKGSHRHHISADVIVHIPKDLHYHIDHSLKDNHGMYEMNLLSLQYLRGWL